MHPALWRLRVMVTGGMCQAQPDLKNYRTVSCLKSGQSARFLRAFCKTRSSRRFAWIWRNCFQNRRLWHSNQFWHADCLRNRQDVVQWRGPDAAQPHQVVFSRGTAIIENGRENMALRPEQQTKTWHATRASQFLWTDFGALFGLIAVTGFAVYRAWF
jgi:hypothetical protein